MLEDSHYTSAFQGSSAEKVDDTNLARELAAAAVLDAALVAERTKRELAEEARIDRMIARVAGKPAPAPAPAPAAAPAAPVEDPDDIDSLLAGLDEVLVEPASEAIEPRESAFARPAVTVSTDLSGVPEPEPVQPVLVEETPAVPVELSAEDEAALAAEITKHEVYEGQDASGNIEMDPEPVAEPAVAKTKASKTASAAPVIEPLVTAPVAKPAGFATLPASLMLDKRLTAVDYRVAWVIALRHRGGKNGRGCFQSMSAIAKLIGSPRQNVSESVSKMIKLDHVVRKDRELFIAADM